MARLAFDVAPGKRMEYELLKPPGFDPTVPTSFVVGISGTGQQHVNHFSRRLSGHAKWAVVCPLRPPDAPLFFQGCGSEGDGLWYLHQFCQHILGKFTVEAGRFLFVGVSNGGNSVVRFATHWPELCRGVVAVTAGINGKSEDLSRLHGLPIDLYVGTKDECGFFAPMNELEAALRSVNQCPPASLTIFESAGHCCSPLVDQSLIIGKLSLMLLKSGPPGEILTLVAPEPGILSSAEISARLNVFCEELGLEHSLDAMGALTAKAPEIAAFKPSSKPAATPNIYMVQAQTPHARTDLPAARPRAQSEHPRAALRNPNATGYCNNDQMISPRAPGAGMQSEPLQRQTAPTTPRTLQTPTTVTVARPRAQSEHPRAELRNGAATAKSNNNNSDWSQTSPRGAAAKRSHLVLPVNLQAPTVAAPPLSPRLVSQPHCLAAWVPSPTNTPVAGASAIEQNAFMGTDATSTSVPCRGKAGSCISPRVAVVDGRFHKAPYSPRVTFALASSETVSQSPTLLHRRERRTPPNA